jgi:hypothetical protein
MSRMYKFLTTLCLLVAVAAIGCNSSTDEFNRKMVPVKGKVTLKGEPLKTDNNLFLVFQKGTERPESIQVNADGTFAGEAVPGENTVALNIYGPPEALGPVKEEYAKGGTQTVTLEANKEVTIEIGE